MDIKANDLEDWGEQWIDMANKQDTGHVNPSYPTDGRDTIYPPYERIASTAPWANTSLPASA